MDTPERSKTSQMATPIANFEDSPVFTFLNSLSPIKPLKSINPLSFASLPSVFSSPHLASLRESRFLRRHQLLDPYPSDDVDTNNFNAKDNACEVAVEFAESSNCNLDIVSSSLSISSLNQNNWDSLIADASDTLPYEPPNIVSHNKSVDPATTFYRSIRNAIQTAQSLGEPARRQPQNMPSHHGEETEMTENDGIVYENLSGTNRGMRRRCLVFEMAGSPSDDSPRPLPGIGLHLNALAATPKDFTTENHESSASMRLFNAKSSSAPTCDEDLFSNTMANYSLSREIDFPVEEDPSHEDINLSSPKKRRRRSEQAGDGESCKRCNCKKSKCLKLYCECFAAGVYCVEPCACVGCFNQPIHEDTVLATRKQIESRNPLAFAPKVIRGSDSLPERGEEFSNTPASARHKRGCNCKKSGCLKKYCECYQGGVGCSVNCRCEGCKNAFGSKDGAATDHEHEEDETDAAEKGELHDEVEESMDSVSPATPLETSRQLPCQPLSKRMLARATFPSICSFSAESGISYSLEYEVPDFLQGGGSNVSGIKSSSPNRKRVLPPRSLEEASERPKVDT